MKSTKVDSPFEDQGDKLIMYPSNEMSLPMEKSLHGNKKHHGQMNRDLRNLVGTENPPYGKYLYLFLKKNYTDILSC